MQMFVVHFAIRAFFWFKRMCQNDPMYPRNLAVLMRGGVGEDGLKEAFKIALDEKKIRSYDIDEDVNLKLTKSRATSFCNTTKNMHILLMYAEVWLRGHYWRTLQMSQRDYQ